MKVTTSAIFAQTSRAICDGIGGLEDKWATGQEIAWRIAGNDRELRREVYGCLDKIASAALWQSIVAVHNGGPLRVFHVRQQALRDYLEGLQ